jgi:hypothetical protein
MLGGHPSPTFPGNSPTTVLGRDEWMAEMDCFAKYVMGFMVPWDKDHEPEFTFDSSGLCNMIDQWDRRSASLVKRQRFRMIDNFISKENRNSQNKVFSGQWRERCAEYWSDLFEGEDTRPSLRGHTRAQEMQDAADMDENNNCTDCEAASKLKYEELFNLTSLIATTGMDEKRSAGICQLRETCKQLHGSAIGPKDYPNNHECNTTASVVQECSHSLARMPVVYCHHGISEDDSTGSEVCEARRLRNMMTLSQIRNQIREMEIVEDEREEIDTDPHEGTSGPPEVHNDADTSILLNNMEDYMMVGGARLTEDQEKVVMCFVNAISENRQELIFLHSGGGTGKSTVVKALNKAIHALGFVQANSCPTGVGATYLDKGKTFHSLFRAYTEDLNASTVIDEIRKQLGGDKLRLIVIDEVSMLKSSHLLLLHRRLCSMYNPNKPFGGILVLLLGDFLQLPTVGGTPLFRAMYDNVNQEDVQVHALFEQFRVIELKQQHRAGQCEVQKQRLQSFRVLPQTYPKFGPRWCKDDMDKFRPITEDIVEGLTTELTTAEIIADERWTTDATCLTTTNLDRSVINNTIANIYGMRKRQTVVRWRRQFRKAFDPCVKDFLETYLYSEDRYP